MMNEALKKAIDHFGGQESLAAAVNRKQPTVSHWLRGGEIPIKIATEIERLTEGAVKRTELRPDIFG